MTLSILTAVTPMEIRMAIVAELLVQLATKTDAELLDGTLLPLITE